MTESERKLKKSDVKSTLEIKKWKFKPCPFCGKNDIGVKDTIIDLKMGHDCPCSAQRRIWAYCRYCGAEGRKQTADIVTDDEEIAVAVESWNRRDIEQDWGKDA